MDSTGSDRFTSTDNTGFDHMEREKIADATALIIHLTMTEHEGSEPFQFAKSIVTPENCARPSFSPRQRTRKDIEPWRFAKQKLEGCGRISGELYRVIDERIKQMSGEMMLFEKIK